MKQNELIAILKNNIFDLFIEGDDSVKELCKKLGVLINDYEKRPTGQSPKSRTTSFI